LYGNDTELMCEVTAQEVGHAFGMEHEYLCQDPMTYLHGCGAKTFQDMPAPCGEFMTRPCACGGASQNSVQHLFSVLGPAEKVPPTVTVNSPADEDTVMAGFSVDVAATDNYLVARVELYVDDALVTSATREPFMLITPKDLAAGPHALEVRAYDAAENIGK